jgi:hypothetical protein
MAITLRTTKGSALTHTEMDTNFSELDSRIIDSAGVASIARSVALDSAEAFQLLLDSSEIINLIDSSYINTYALNTAAVSSLISSEGYTKLDSTDTMGIIDSHVDADFIAVYVDSAFVALRAPDYTTYYQEQVLGTVDSDYVFTKQRKYIFADDFQADTELLINNKFDTIDSDFIQARQLIGIDSSDVLSLIPTVSLDSAEAIALIDSDYVQARSTASTALANDLNPALANNLDMKGFALSYKFLLTANDSTTAYLFNDSNNNFFPTIAPDPILYLRRGEKYSFVNQSGGHPLEIQDSDGNAYEIGVTNNRDSASSGIVSIIPSMLAPPRLKYQCTTHPAMGGIINIV